MFYKIDSHAATKWTTLCSELNVQIPVSAHCASASHNDVKTQVVTAAAWVYRHHAEGERGADWKTSARPRFPTDPGYMNRKIRKFRTNKFDARNKRKNLTHVTPVNGWEPGVSVTPGGHPTEVTAAAPLLLPRQWVTFTTGGPRRQKMKQTVTTAPGAAAPVIPV